MEPGLKAGGGAWSLFAANHLAPSFLLTPDLSERGSVLEDPEEPAQYCHTVNRQKKVKILLGKGQDNI
jgi:hypothetical protein